MQIKEISYSMMRKSLTITSFILIVIPILIISWVTTYNIKKCAVHKIEMVESSIIEHRKDVINLFLKEQGDLLVTLTGMYSLDYLGQQEHLERLFIAVNQTNEIVDLHVIDSSGEQLAYVGPYRSSIKGKSYHGMPWFEEVLVSGRHVSDVFSGYRDVPHLVVAVTDPLKTYILRATINSEIFNALLLSAQIGANGDAYIINREGEFQTPSLQGAKALTAEEKKFLEHHEGTAVQTIGADLYTSKWIHDGQWLLVIKSRIEDSFDMLYKTRNAHFFIIGITSSIVLMVAVFVSWYMVRRLEIADRGRLEIEQHIIQVEKMATLGRLAAGIAHEINNPLQMITNQAGWIDELLVEENPSQVKNLEEYQESIGKIKYHVTRAGTITHRLLGFSRKMTADKECVNVNELIDETLSFVEKDALHKNIHIVKKFATDLPTTMTDGRQLQQVFLNLLNNGLDAVKEDGEIEIQTREEANFICIGFADSGTGIEPEVMDKLFDPFFTTKDPGKGTGLGMSICYDIIRKLGGEIDVRNRKKGGAVFTLKLPIVQLGD
ncbi:MAG: ATP-binding protein [Thermodesulfobacteriota bacterium]|nr:ATP-binding protein [Thermodesulfobacteriota bacterium]